MKNISFLTDLLVCPRTKSDLTYIDLGHEAAFLSKEGILYPVIDNIVVMNPVIPQVKSICARFLDRNEAYLSRLNSDYNRELSKKVLLSTPEDEAHKWNYEEMVYWEESFKDRLQKYRLHKPSWNRELPRWKLLKNLPRNLNRGVTLEIGCGGFSTPLNFYKKNLKNYIGLDLSFYACSVAQKMFPQGFYINASAESLPLRDNSIDVVFAYSVLHHLPGHEENVRRILPVLKPKGYLIGFDPLLKPRLPRPNLKGIYNFMKKEKEFSENNNKEPGSPHNDRINWENLLHVIKHKADVLKTYYGYGPLRTLLIQNLYDKMGIQSKFFTRLVIFLDQLWLCSIGRLHRSIGPAAIHYALQKH